MHRTTFLALALLAFFAWRSHSASGSNAATVIELDLAGLAERAELVLEAQVEASVSQLDARGRIETRYTLTTSRTFHGSEREQHVVRMPGGVLPDGRGLVIPGLPRLAVGDEALLFLTPESRAGLRLPVGLAQGRFELQRLADGTRRLVRDHGALDYVDAAGRALPERPAREVLDYASTVNELQRILVARRERERAERVRRREEPR